jgi:hypothetical protein
MCDQTQDNSSMLNISHHLIDVIERALKEKPLLCDKQIDWFFFQSCEVGGLVVIIHKSTHSTKPNFLASCCWNLVLKR